MHTIPGLVVPLEGLLPTFVTTLVFVATDIDRGRRLSKLLLKQATVVEFGGLATPGGRGGWVEAMRTEAGKMPDLREQPARAQSPAGFRFRFASQPSQARAV